MKKRRGFTLIEVVVIMVLIALMIGSMIILTMNLQTAERAVSNEVYKAYSLEDIENGEVYGEEEYKTYSLEEVENLSLEQKIKNKFTETSANIEQSINTAETFLEEKTGIEITSTLGNDIDSLKNINLKQTVMFLAIIIVLFAISINRLVKYSKEINKDNSSFQKLENK